jgi:hypothetical protein
LFLIAVTFLSDVNASMASIWSALLLGGPRLSVGMETGLYVAAIMAALLAVNGRAFRTAFVLAVASVLLRPDGIIAAAAIAGSSWFMLPLPWRERTSLLSRSALPALVLVAIAGLVCLAVFSTVIPHSVVAKRAFSCEITGCFTTGGMLDELVGALGRGTAAFLMFFATPGAMRAIAARLWNAWPLLFWGLTYVFVFGAAKAPASPWYYAPLAPVLTTMTVFGIAGPWPFRTWAVRWIGSACLAAAVVLTTQSVMARPVPRSINGVEPERARLAQTTLDDMSARRVETARVLTFEVGYLGYVIPGRVIDLLGVVTRGEQPCLTHGNGSAALGKIAPDYVVVIDQPYPGTACIASASELSSRYAMLAKVSRDFGYFMDYYVVYRRN